MADEINVENINEVVSTQSINTPINEVEATYIEQVKELTVAEIEKKIKEAKNKFIEEENNLKQDLEDAKAKIIQEEIKLSELWVVHRSNAIVVLLFVVALKVFGVI
jgi:phage anti-repressor protein